MKKYIFFSLFWLLLSGCIFTGVPFVPVPIDQLKQNDIYYEFEEVPKIVNRDETSRFIIKTNPGNSCYGMIDYFDSSEVFRGVELPTQIADEEGLCIFEWQIGELDVLPGYGIFNVVIQENEEYVTPDFKEFCLIECY